MWYSVTGPLQVSINVDNGYVICIMKRHLIEHLIITQISKNMSKIIQRQRAYYVTKSPFKK